jgi:hypothetical protein
MRREFIVLYLLGLGARGYQVGDPIGNKKFGRDILKLVNEAPGHMSGIAITFESLWEVILHIIQNE